jgi:hypothetical protein
VQDGEVDVDPNPTDMLQEASGPLPLNTKVMAGNAFQTHYYFFHQDHCPLRH